MKPTSWDFSSDEESCLSLQLHFGDFNTIDIDGDGINIAVFARNGFITAQKKLSWEEVFFLANDVKN